LSISAVVGGGVVYASMLRATGRLRGVGRNTSILIELYLSWCRGLCSISTICQDTFKLTPSKLLVSAFAFA